jgi:hypothetical protein
VEVGSHYLEEGWGTRLMTLTDFIAAMTAATPGEFVGQVVAVIAAGTAGPGCGQDSCNVGCFLGSVKGVPKFCGWRDGL